MWKGCTRKKKLKRRTTTITTMPNVHIDVVNQKVLDCVTTLEKEEQLFASYLIDDWNKGDLVSAIMEFMNENVSEIFNCRLQNLKQENGIAIAAVHAFYRTSELGDKWTKSELPLFTGLLMCYILRSMSRTFEGLHEWGQVELYNQTKNELEEKVLELLEVAYRTSERKTRRALKINYHALIERDHDHSPACSILSLLDLAMMAKCEKFLNHSMCRRISNERWTPRISISRIHFICAFFAFFPIFTIPFDRKVKYLTKKALDEKEFERRASRIRTPMLLKSRVRQSIFSKSLETVVRNMRNIKDFYTSPCSNFAVHTTFYIFYILLFAYVLLTRGRYDIQFTVDIFGTFLKEILLVVWQISFFADMVYSILQMGYTKFRARNPADLTHNVFNFLWIFLFIISAVLHEFKVLPLLWGFLVVTCKFFFHVSFIFSSVRIMRVFSADSFFGSIVVMMKKMVYTLWSFLIVFLLFWSTYAIAVSSLLEETPSFRNLAWSIFSNGAFEIFGDMQDEIKNGKIEECPSTFNGTEIRDFTINCFFRTWMLPILLFVYVLVSSVLLVNLVTSFFTNTFEQVRDSSMLHYRYKHYQRLVEYETKIRFPAPLSLLYYFFLSFLNVAGCCFGPFLLLCRRGKADSVEVSKPMVPLMPTTYSYDEDGIELMHMCSESISVDSRPTKSVNIIVDEDHKNKNWKKMSDKDKMADIVKFIQKSMKVVRKQMRVDREERLEEEPGTSKNKKLKKKMDLSGDGSFFGYFRKTLSGQVKLSITKLSSTPFLAVRRGKRYIVMEDTRKRNK